MQWFRHPSNFRCEPKLRAIEKMLGELEEMQPFYDEASQ